MASAPGVVKVTYRMGIPFGPCGKVLRTYVKSAQGWSLERKCDDPAGPPTTSDIDEKEFNATVYMKTRLASDPTLGEIALEAALGAGKRAPEGSVRCYRSSDGANTVCENAKGVITYSAFNGYKLNPPKMDANRSYRLVSYEEK